MQVDPQKSREAHTQTGRLTQAAASSIPQQDSLIRCDPRGPQPASCRGDDAGQRSRKVVPLREHQLGMDGQPFDYPVGVRFIRPDQLESIATRPARHITIDPLPTWREGAVPLALGATAAILVGLVIAYLQSRGLLQ